MLSCSTGGQILDETNLFSFFREVIFPQAGKGQIRAPVLPTFLAGIIIENAVDELSISEVKFPVETSNK